MIGKDELTDCVLYTIPCTACCATCQDANEVRERGVAAPIDERPFAWGPDVDGAMKDPVLPVSVTAAPEPVRAAGGCRGWAGGSVGRGQLPACWRVAAGRAAARLLAPAECPCC